MRLLRIHTDRGTEFWGSFHTHGYQLYLAIEDIDHSRTKAWHPQTNGMCERFRGIVKKEFYEVAFRKRIYRSLEELHSGLDQWLEYYNGQRPHTGRYCDGRAPLQAFAESQSLAKQKEVDVFYFG